ncbi:MAG: polysaccharide biosynthesis protein, partial [Cytophagaceae bacterium]|nr:polysaccharide biosynthesis protein [Cytophagaceae bacterium]
MNKLIQSLPRWTVLQLDIFICSASLFLAYALRFNFDISEEMWGSLFMALPVVLMLKGIFFYYTKSYAGIIRFTSIEDAKKI